MFRVSWRLQRGGLIGMSLFGFLYGLGQSAAYVSAAGTTAASRALFGHQMELLGPTLSYFLPLPVRADTVAGYMQWRVYGGLPLLFGFWAIMSASGATRGDEERGLLEQWLAWGIPRTRYMWVRFAGFTAVAAVVVSCTAVGAYLGSLTAETSLNLGALVEDSAALVALLVCCYAIVLLVAQLATTRAAAASLGGTLLLAAFLIDGASHTSPGMVTLARIVSPFYYYNQTTALRPGGVFDAEATAGLVVLGVVLVALAAWMLAQRDIGSALFTITPRGRQPTTTPSTNPLLRIPVIASLYEQRNGVLAWSVGTAIMATAMARLAPQVGSFARGPGAFHAYLSVVGPGDPQVAVAGYVWFGFFELLLAVFAITQVARWSAEDNDGRLEMVLTTPVSRGRVVLERSITLACGAAIVVGISSVAFFTAGRGAGIDLKAGDVLVAGLVMAPFALTFGAVGAVLASRVPRVAVAVLGAVAFLSYMLAQLGPLLKFPTSVLKLSIFSLVGNPLTDGVYWTGLWIMLAVIVAGFGAATLLMRRREVGR